MVSGGSLLGDLPLSLYLLFRKQVVIINNYLKHYIVVSGNNVVRL